MEDSAPILLPKPRMHSALRARSLWNIRTTVSNLIVWCFALIAAGTADAIPFSITIERISDVEATLTVSGQLSGPAPRGASILKIVDPFELEPSGDSNESVISSSTLYCGGLHFNFAYDVGADYSGTPYILFHTVIGDLVAGKEFTGALNLKLAEGTFAPVGSSGDVFWGVEFTNCTGMWTMVAPQSVPDTGSTVALLGLALVGVGFVRRKLSI